MYTYIYIIQHNNTFIFIARNTREVKNNILMSSSGSPVLRGARRAVGDRRARRGVFGGRKKILHRRNNAPLAGQPSTKLRAFEPPPPRHSPGVIIVGLHLVLDVYRAQIISPET